MKVVVLDNSGDVVAETTDPKMIAVVRVFSILEGRTPRARKRIVNFVLDYIDEEEERKTGLPTPKKRKGKQ